LAKGVLIVLDAMSELAQAPRDLPGKWQHFAHGADIGVRGIGATKEQAFEQAAIALVGVITDPARVAAKREVIVECEAADREVLLVDWLNALIYEMAVRRMLFRCFEVRLEGTRLHGRAWGEEIEIARHEPAVEVKGATYTGLFVGRNATGDWVAQCVVDV
jgi:tRNA nucleotidyltransferase (CCA-adding enzyme)